MKYSNPNTGVILVAIIAISSMLVFVANVSMARATAFEQATASFVHDVPQTGDIITTLRYKDGKTKVIGLDPIVATWANGTRAELKKVMIVNYRVSGVENINIDLLSGERYTDKTSGIRLDDIACK